MTGQNRARDRILLSGPDVGVNERAALLRAFDSGWIAPAGPELGCFEAELADYVGVEACVALSSGTAALHLSLLDLGVGPGDEVVVQTATFAATAFAVAYTGATPVFCDIDEETLGISPQRLEDLLASRAASGRLPRAVIPVDLYGCCANYKRIVPLCQDYGVPVIEDAAEALGSESGGQRAGSFGRCGVLSFNGNKIITTSGGGAVIGPKEIVERCRYLSTQARQPVLHYEHHDIGYNYRLSNLLAAIGRAQLSMLDQKIERRAEIAAAYRSAPALASLSWPGMATTSRPNYWLNMALLPESIRPNLVCDFLEDRNIEARPAWAPMHQQPIFEASECVGGEVAERIFERGICLPSGSGLATEQVEFVVSALSDALEKLA